MKTNRLLKITLSISILAFLSTNVFGQTYPGNLIENTDPANQIDSVTHGNTLPYYVEPDPILNPDFSGGDVYPTNSGDLSQGEEWNWWLGTTGTVGGSTDNQGTAGGDADNDGPYIEVEWNDPNAGAVGAPVEDSIYVQESNTDVSGGCEGDTSYLRVLVFDQPEFTPVDGSNALIELCGTQDYDIPIASVEDNHVQTGNLKFKFDISCDNVDPADPTGPSTGTVSGRTNTDSVVAVTTPVNGDGTAEGPFNMLTNYDIRIQNNDVTRYRFSFGGSGDGISDQISRQSDYLNVGGSDPTDETQWTYYPATNGGNGTNIDVVVYPAPNTGNIYYVPNDFDQ